MLVSAKEMTAAARAGHYAIGAFNLNNLEWTKAVLKAAQECNAPVSRNRSVLRRCRQVHGRLQDGS